MFACSAITSAAARLEVTCHQAQLQQKLGVGSKLAEINVIALLDRDTLPPALGMLWLGGSSTRVWDNTDGLRRQGGGGCGEVSLTRSSICIALM